MANETLLFDVVHSDGRSVGYVARLASPDPLYLEYDLTTHYRMYTEMMRVPTVPTPRVVGYESDPAAIGAEFFVMERIDGSIPTDNPSWATTGFVVDASPSERHTMWRGAIEMLARFHQLNADVFKFLLTGATEDGVGDCLDYWIRSLRWAAPSIPVPLTEQAEEWLVTTRPVGTGLSWGDSRLPNVVFRGHCPVGLLDWDLVSLAGPQADLAWWIIMTPAASLQLEGIGDHDDFIDLWEGLTGVAAVDLHWYLVFGAYRLAAVMAKLLTMFVAQGRMTSEDACHQLATGPHVQLLSGLLDIRPPAGVTPRLPSVRLER